MWGALVSSVLQCVYKKRYYQEFINMGETFLVNCVVDVSNTHFNGPENQAGDVWGSGANTLTVMVLQPLIISVITSLLDLILPLYF